MGFLGDTLILLQYDLFRTGSRLPGHLDFAGSELHLLVFVISSEPRAKLLVLSKMGSRFQD